jgi:exonuclease SbcD
MSAPVRPFRFLHCADLHLDSPIKGVSAVDQRVGDVLREATFQAFDNVIDFAVREQVDLLIIAGDVYDGADRSLRAQLRFRDGLARAAEAGVHCFVSHGNHDPLDGWQVDLKLPERVHRFGDQVESVVITRDDTALVEVSGISYPTRDVQESLCGRFSRGDAAPFAIGVLHCNVGGNAEHDNYAGCNLEELAAVGLDYWALGHIHARQILRDREPAVVYPGNTQGRSIREQGPRGCYLVEVYEGGRLDTHFIATDAVRWFQRDIDIGALTGIDDLLSMTDSIRQQVRDEAEGRPAMLRLMLVGRGGLHGELRHESQRVDLLEQLRENESDREDFVWVEKLRDETRPAIDIPQRREVEDFVGDFLRSAERLRRADDPAEAIRGLLAARKEHRAIAQELEGLDENELIAMLAGAEALGLDLLLEGNT